jgi:hypothetical protein
MIAPRRSAELALEGLAKTAGRLIAAFEGGTQIVGTRLDQPTGPLEPESSVKGQRRGVMVLSEVPANSGNVDTRHFGQPGFVEAFSLVAPHVVEYAVQPFGS